MGLVKEATKQQQKVQDYIGERIKTAYESGDITSMANLDNDVLKYKRMLWEEQLNKLEKNALEDKTRVRINNLPAGAVQIGTSGGKPVYQTPDGRKFLSE